jgi:type IV pilus assembly protein PilM
MLVGNISRVLDYYFSRNTDVELTRVTLTGLGADCVGLDRLLSNELDVFVEPVRRINTVDVAHDMPSSYFFAAEYYGNIGAAVKPLNLSFVGESEQQEVSLKIPALVCVGGLAVSISLILTQLLSNMVMETDNEEMVLEMQRQSSAIDSYNYYTEMMVINQELSMLNASATAPNDVLLDFIAELETNIPSDMIVQSLTSDSSGTVTLALTCNSKASAAEMLIQLRGCRTVETLSCTGVQESKDDSGKKTVQFNVTCTLNPDYNLVDETEEQMEIEGETGTESTETTEITD